MLAVVSRSHGLVGKALALSTRSAYDPYPSTGAVVRSDRILSPVLSVLLGPLRPCIVWPLVLSSIRVVRLVSLLVGLCLSRLYGLLTGFVSLY